MTSNETNSATNPGRVRITLAAIAAMSVIAVILMGVMTAQAQSGAVPNLELSSTSPGGLTITWDAPDPAPSDYRVIWAKQDLDFPSYKAANEASRGNEYPGGTETSITLTGLAGGETFKARMRARYTSGGQNNGSWSGPWTDTVTTRVKDDPPAAPTGLTADASYDSMTLNWTAPTQGTVTGYRVFRGTDADSLSAIVQDTGNTGTEYTDSTVAAETTYFYAVLALSQDGDGQQSAALSTTTPAAPHPVPSAPTGLTAAPSHDRVTLSWDEPQDSSITGYQIWRGADAASLASINADTGSALGSYVDDTVTAETVYHYAVLALNPNGPGAQSATVSATTTATPQQTTETISLQLSSTNPGELTISWTGPVPAPSDYRVIWAKQDLGFPSYKAANEANRGNEYPGGTETSITLTGLAKGETFKAQMRARYTSGGENGGPWSGPLTETVTTRVKDDPPAAPTGLTADASHDSITLTWTAPATGTVTGYLVLRGTEAGSLTTLAEESGSQHTDSTVTAETTYYYAVLALSQDGNGVQSTTVSTTTPAEPRQQQENTNSVPTASNGTVATNEDTDHAFSAREFNYSDSDSDSDTLASVKITELPAAGRGRLTLDGPAINLADLPKTITKAEPDDGKLIYSPPADANGTGYASFKFKVNDGSADSTDAHTMTISVTAVNDPATGAPAISGTAEVGETLTASTSGIADPDGLPSSFTHQWKRFAADGTTFEANIGIDSDTYTLTASEQDARVKVEVSFTDNEGSSEGPLASAAYPSDATVEASEEGASSSGISIIVEAPPRTTVGSAGTVSADVVGFDVFPDPDGHEYTYRIDVLDSDGNDADVCESNGMGEALRIFKNKTAWIFVRPGATELREAQISDQCEIGSYTARASVSDADSALLVSAEAEFEITRQPPAAPTGLTTSGVTHNSITLSWTDPEDTSITGYRVLRGTEAGNLTAIAQDTGSDSVEYTDSTVAAETAYHYAVLALSQNVDGAQSATVSVTTRAAPEPKKGADKPPTDRVTRAAPGVPLNLAVAPGDAQLTFTWDPPTSDGGSAIVRYNYQFGPSGGTQPGGNHGTDPVGSQTLTKTGLTNGTAYTFKVRAVTNFGGSTTVGAHTNVVTGTPADLVPTVTSIVQRRTSPTQADTLIWRVTFSEAMQNVDTADFSVAGTTATLAVSAVSGVTGTYDVTASGGDLTGLNATVTLSFTATQNIQDTSSNALSDTTPTGTNEAIYVVDNTPPTLTSATVNATGTSIVLDLSEDLYKGSNLVDTLFRVHVDSISITISAVNFTMSSDEVSLTVSPAIYQGQAVVVSYFDTSPVDNGRVIEDLALNDAASFTTGSNSVPAVTNSSTVAAVVPGAPTGLGATADGPWRIDLSWTAPADNGGRAITGYKVEWSTDGSAPWTILIADTGNTNTTYAHTGHHRRHRRHHTALPCLGNQHHRHRRYLHHRQRHNAHQYGQQCRTIARLQRESRRRGLVRPVVLH